MRRRLSHKVVIVTGAAQGIGKGIALGAAKEGALVLLADQSPLVHHVCDEIKQSGGIATDLLVDLESYEGAERMVQAAITQFGRIDVLINNVGGAIWMKPFDQFSSEQIIKEVNRSLFSTIWGCRAVIPEMVEQGSGVIVNISSIATKGINRMPYSAAKGGVNALTRALAFEYADRGIRVNAIATGGTQAPTRVILRNEQPLSPEAQVWMDEVVDQTLASTHLKRYGTIEEQVHVALFLASDEASYITGSIIPVAGGDQG